MVDSIKIRVFCTSLKKEGLDSLELKRVGHLQFSRLSHDFTWGGSYQYKINFKIFRENTLEMEFSVPKLLYGHNLKDDDVKTESVLYALKLIKQKLDSDYCKTENLEDWEILRLDVCQNFKVNDIEKTLLRLSSLSYRKKKTHVYPSSVMWVGSTYSIKFYDKQTEFKKHDFSRIVQNTDVHNAFKLLASTENILRFEVTLRKRALAGLFRSERVTVNNLIKLPVEKNKRIAELLKWAQKQTQFKTTQDLVTHHVFVAKLGKTRGTRLYNFWQQWQTKTGQTELKRMFTRNTLYRKMKQAEKVLQEYIAEISSFSRNDVPFESETPLLPERAKPNHSPL